MPGRAVQYYDVASYLVGRWACAFTLLITVISLFSTSVSPALPECSRSQADISCRVAGASATAGVLKMTFATPRNKFNILLAVMSIFNAWVAMEVCHLQLICLALQASPRS